MQSRERTRSRRWRSGTRHNKKYPTTHKVVCPMLGVCLVHTPGDSTRLLDRRHPAMAMRLTRCEQAWVDDVRAGRDHVHIVTRVVGPQSRREMRYAAIRIVFKRINTARMKASGTVNTYALAGAQISMFPSDEQETRARQQVALLGDGSIRLQMGTAQYGRR